MQHTSLIFYKQTSMHFGFNFRTQPNMNALFIWNNRKTTENHCRNVAVGHVQPWDTLRLCFKLPRTNQHPGNFSSIQYCITGTRYTLANSFLYLDFINTRLAVNFCGERFLSHVVHFYPIFCVHFAIIAVQNLIRFSCYLFLI